MIYALWQPDQATPPPFEALFDDLPGDILEGGATLTDALDHLQALPSDNGIHILELSLSIEYRAKISATGNSPKSSASRSSARWPRLRTGKVRPTLAMGWQSTPAS
jgi:hypothetical protein